jgi:hypothetical protein
MALKSSPRNTVDVVFHEETTRGRKHLERKDQEKAENESKLAVQRETLTRPLQKQQQQQQAEQQQTQLLTQQIFDNNENNGIHINIKSFFDSYIN